MDIYDYLKMDHQKVAHLFSLFEKSKVDQRKREIVAMITQELMVHAHSEQETFYKRLAQSPISNDIAGHGKKEHQEIEDHLKKVNDPNKKNWHQEVLSLKKIVDHHVSEEEGKMFGKAREVLSEKEALMLKEKMHYLKGNFLIWLKKNEKDRI